MWGTFQFRECSTQTEGGPIGCWLLVLEQRQNHPAGYGKLDTLLSQYARLALFHEISHFSSQSIKPCFDIPLRTPFYSPCPRRPIDNEHTQLRTQAPVLLDSFQQAQY